MSDGEYIELTGGEALIRIAVNLGITHVFGLVGGKLGPLFKALSVEPRLAYLGVRHEATGAFMAAGAAARSGKIAMALAETAPGGLNLASALGVAYANSLPVLAITSDHVAGLSTPSRGAFSSGDNVQVFAPVTKWNARIQDASRVPELMRMAFRQALSGRQGPVHLDVPTDVLGQRVRFLKSEIEAPLRTFTALDRTLADPASVARAAEQLLNAKRPLLIAGGGVPSSHGVRAFRALAEQLGAVATSTQMALGSVATDDPKFIGHGGFIGGEGVIKALKEADVVLAVGCRFSSWMWLNGAPLFRAAPDRTLIQVDIDPLQIGVNHPVDIGLVGDASAVMGQFADSLAGRRRSGSDWETSVVAARSDFVARLKASAREGEGALHPALVAERIGDQIGENDLVVFDGGHTSFWSNEFTPALHPRTRFHDPGMAQLGFGLGYAMAMQALHPDRRVYQITGDGAFGFCLAELDTARRYGLPVITLVHNNAAFGVIGFSQDRQGFRFGEELTETDYAAIARGFGCHGETVKCIEELDGALERARASGLPAVIDIHTRFTPHPLLPVFGKSSSLEARE